MCTVAPNQRQAGTKRGDVAACVCQSQREIVKYSEALSTAAEEQFFIELVCSDVTANPIFN